MSAVQGILEMLTILAREKKYGLINRISFIHTTVHQEPLLLKETYLIVVPDTSVSSTTYRANLRRIGYVLYQLDHSRRRVVLVLRMFSRSLMLERLIVCVVSYSLSPTVSDVVIQHGVVRIYAERPQAPQV